MSLIYINPYAFPAAAGIVASGLALHLDAGNTASYPGTGTTWTDLSGNGNNGTLTNGPTYSSADGGSIVLGVSNDYINLSNLSLPLINVSQFTYSTFIKITSSTANIATLFSFGSNGEYSRDILLYYNNTSVFFQVNNGSDGGGGFAYTRGSWSNISAVYDGTQSTNATRLKMYLNGVQQTLSFNYTVPATTSSIPHIGAAIGVYSTAGYGVSEAMTGNIAQALIYNRALTAAEVTQNFDARRGRYGL